MSCRSEKKYFVCEPDRIVTGLIEEEISQGICQTDYLAEAAEMFQSVLAKMRVNCHCLHLEKKGNSREGKSAKYFI